MKKVKPVSKITVGKFKPVKYYEADISAPDATLKIFIDLGREVITDEQLLSIGFNYAITSAINSQFELTSVSKKKGRK